MHKAKRGLAGGLAVMVLAAGALPGTALAQTQNQKAKVQQVENQSRLNADSAKEVNQKVYAQDEMVTVIVEMDAPSVMDYFQTSGYAGLKEQTSAGQAVAQYLASNSAKETAQQLLQQQQEVIHDVQGLVESDVTDRAANSKEGQGNVVAQWSTLVNAVAIQVPYGQLEEIRALEGVKNAYVEHVYERPEEQAEAGGDKAWYSYSYDKVGVEGAWQAGYTGQGMLVAVLDTGLDLSSTADGTVTRVHEAFTDASFKNDPTSWTMRYTKDSVVEFVGSTQLNATGGAALYKNLKVPFAYDYAEQDLDVHHPTEDHGTHVSGTVLGYAKTAEGAETFSGIAPDAQLLSMKVFPDGDGGAPESVTITALEDSLKLGADVINLSLGSDNGFADDDTMQNAIYKTIEEAGILLMTAAGNSAYASASNNYNGNPLTSDVDTAMMSSPGIYKSNLAVASLDNAIQVESYFTWDNDGTTQEVSFTDPSAGGVQATFGNGTSYPVYLVDGVGSVEDYAKVDWYNQETGTGVTGFALVKRGELAFGEKVINAEGFSTVVDGVAKGVLGVLVYDNNPEATEMVNMSVEGAKLHSAFVCGVDGYALETALKAGKEVNILVSAEDRAVANPTDGQMSSFSSWGAGPGLELKPEITAPGGNIWSTVNDKTHTGDDASYIGGYSMMSGTSMATPHMSGISALVRQYVQSNPFFAGYTADQVGDVVNQLMVSTAIPQKDTNGVYYSPRQQGAGLVNVTNALNTPAYVTVEGKLVGKLELLDDAQRTGSYDIAFDVHNISDQSVTYQVAITLMRPDTQNVSSAWGQRETILHQDVVIKTVDLGTVTVAGGQTTSFSANVSLTEAEKAQLNELFEDGVYVEGFVSLTDTAQQAPTLGLPMLAYYGDWTAASILDNGSWLDPAQDGTNVYQNEASWGVSMVGSTVIDWSTNSIQGYLDLGLNPLEPKNTAGFYGNNITISPNGDEYFDRIDYHMLYQLRDAKLIAVEVKDAQTGEVYFRDGVSYVTRTVFNSDYGAAVPISGLYYGAIPIWDGTDANGQALPSGTKCVYTLTAYGEGDYGDKVYDEEMGYEVTDFGAVLNGKLPTFNGHEMDLTGDVLSFPVTVDTQAPQISQETVAYYQENGRTYMEITVEEDGALAGFDAAPLVVRVDKSGNPVDVVLGDTLYSETLHEDASTKRVFTLDITDYLANPVLGQDAEYDYIWSGAVSVYACDYGANESTFEISTNVLGLSQTSAQMVTGETLKLEVTNLTGETGEVSFSSSNEAVAKVDQTGLVTAVGAGEAVITAKLGEATATCKVQVTAQMYTVSFVDADGTLISSVQVVAGECVGEPQAPQREGYTFAGWYTDAQYTTAYHFATPVQSDLTLYAKWVEEGTTPVPTPTPTPVPEQGVTLDNRTSNPITLGNAAQVFAGGTVVKVESVLNGVIFQRVQQALKNVVSGMDQVAIFEFTASKDGVSVQPNGALQVTFQIPANLTADQLKMYYVAEDGSTQLVPITVDKAANTVTANLYHFSTYVLANTQTQGGTTVPGTGDTAQMTSYLVAMVASMGMLTALMVVTKRRQK